MKIIATTKVLQHVRYKSTTTRLSLVNGGKINHVLGYGGGYSYDAFSAAATSAAFSSTDPLAAPTTSAATASANGEFRVFNETKNPDLAKTGFSEENQAYEIENPEFPMIN